ncbi:hypothetical protein IK110_00320 [Candidatus Saccharibacteria bacterium]|nr:hypothetical protein [Candidatus Saccharibacteria bacterium]
MLRLILNFFITCLILFLASLWCPQFVYVGNFLGAMLVVFLLCLIEIVVKLLGLFIAAIGERFDNCLWVIIGFLILVFAKIGGLMFLSYKLDYFWISGFWTALVLSILFSVFSIGSSEKKN